MSSQLAWLSLLGKPYMQDVQGKAFQNWMKYIAVNDRDLFNLLIIIANPKSSRVPIYEKYCLPDWSTAHLRARKRTPKGQLHLRFPAQENLPRRFWQRRYYDFNVYSRAKVLEKLHYMHSNPVRERLVRHPGDWPLSSWSFYYRDEGILATDPWTQPMTASRNFK